MFGIKLVNSLARVRHTFALWCSLVACLLWSPLSLGGEPLVVAVSRSPLSLPLYVAQSEGYFDREGLSVRFDEVVGGHRSMQEMLEGRAHMATSSEAVVMFNSFKRQDFALVASFVTSKEDLKLLVRRDSGITSVKQLAQKKVGTVIGSASHYYLDTLLAVGGLDPRNVQVLGLQPEAMGAALNSREVAAVAVWQPFPYRIEREVPGSMPLADGGIYTLSFNLLVARGFLQQRDRDVVRFLRALDRAERLIMTEPARAQAVLKNKLQLEQAYIDWQWPRYRYRLSLDQALLTTLESEARWALAEGHISAGRAPNFLDIIDTKPLQRVVPAAVGISE